jgi:hypothetical protein
MNGKIDLAVLTDAFEVVRRCVARSGRTVALLDRSGELNDLDRRSLLAEIAASELALGRAARALGREDE